MKQFLVSYVCIMFFFGSVFAIVNGYYVQIDFVNYRNFPGIGKVLPPGPAGYSLYTFSDRLSVLGNVAYTLANWFADGLLVRLFLHPFLRTSSSSHMQ